MKIVLRTKFTIAPKIMEIHFMESLKSLHFKYKTDNLITNAMRELFFGKNTNVTARQLLHSPHHHNLFSKQFLLIRKDAQRVKAGRQPGNIERVSGFVQRVHNHFAHAVEQRQFADGYNAL